MLSQIAAFLADAKVAYILLLVGIYGLFYEFYHPRLVLPGAIGVISFILAIYSFQLIPVNYVGLAFILIGIILMMVEILISSFGILGLGGILAFVTGSILLLDVHKPHSQIAWSLILIMTIFTLFFFIIVVGLAVRTMRKKTAQRQDALIGSEAEVIEYVNDHDVLIRAEDDIWKARAKERLVAGQKVTIKNINKQILIVEPATTRHKTKTTRNEL